MSHASAQVLFHDGLLMHAEYDGTSDAIRTLLFRTPLELSARWREDRWWEHKCTCGRSEVALYSEDYGGGSHGLVCACRHCRVITDVSQFRLHDDPEEDVFMDIVRGRRNPPLWEGGAYEGSILRNAKQRQDFVLIQAAARAGRGHAILRHDDDLYVRLTDDGGYTGTIVVPLDDEAHVLADMMEADGCAVVTARDDWDWRVAKAVKS